MTGLQVALAEDLLVAFLAAVARTAAFVMVCPPFSARAVPARVRTGLALALALPLTGRLLDAAPGLDSSALLPAMAVQALAGVTTGFVVLCALAAVQAVGDLLDTVGGFTVAMGTDPLMLVQTSVFGRLHQMTVAALVLAGEGHLMIIEGLARGTALLPGAAPDRAVTARTVTAATGDLLAGAVEVAAPVIAAMLVADVALGLLTRAAPALNAFALGYPVKILFTLLLAGLVMARLPAEVLAAAERAALTAIGLAGG